MSKQNAKGGAAVDCKFRQVRVEWKNKSPRLPPEIFRRSVEDKGRSNMEALSNEA